MKKMIPMFLAAFAVVFFCACSAVTPGPSTTRSIAAQVSVTTTAASKEQTSRAQMSDATDEGEETTGETDEETTGETGEETTEETDEEMTETEESTTREEEETTRKAEDDEQEDGETVYARSAVNVRDAASRDSNVVGTLSEGEAVTKLSEDGGWTKILYNGMECYVSTSFLTDERP